MSGLGASLNGLPERLAQLFTNPTSNFPAALALYAVIALLLLIVVTIGIVFVLGSGDDETSETQTDSDEDEAVPASGEISARERRARRLAPIEAQRRLPRWVATVVCAAVLAVLWVGIGYTTASQETCTGCHASSPHAASERSSDPHARVSCVACHESGSIVGRYVTDVPGRTIHIVGALLSRKTSLDYGRPSQAACLSCHRSDIAGTTLDKARGLRMSHAEPLAASATCLDCHVPKSGVVSSRGVGMNVCLRCHDSKKASSDCATCHDKRASAAARVRLVAPAVQVPQVTCGGCHDQKRECDTCHGVRMPHTKEFMAYAHARAGAVDLWFNNGATCGKCHTATNNPCTTCHSSMLGTAHGPSMAVSHKGGNAVACNTCHQSHAYSPSRDFCKDLCHSPAAIEASPR